MAWSFFSIIIDKWSEANEDMYARLILLSLIATYLIEDWLLTENESNKLKKFYWVGDAFHSLAFTLFSLSIYYTKSNSMFWSAISVMVIPMLGHAFSCWEIKDTNRNYLKRFYLAGIDLAGLTIFLFTYFMVSKIWSYCFGVITVLILWYRFRKKLYYGN
ncbi:MAG: hypothetical protein EOP00_02620 [Pedobacter sp.]|nr:MAG: hypothetical protein EOP00_02620 [Pedobacter sp.]